MQVMQVYHLLPKVHNGQKTRQQLKPHPSNCATSRMEIDRRRRSDEPTQDYGNRREEMEGRKEGLEQVEKEDKESRSRVCCSH